MCRKGVAIDIPSGSYYETAISWANENGIANGIRAGYFAPNNPVTRAELVTMLYHVNGSPPILGETVFDDHYTIPSYATMAVVWATNTGILNGAGNNMFAPNERATRAQTATILYRYINLSSETIKPPEQTERKQITIVDETGKEVVFELNSSKASSYQQWGNIALFYTEYTATNGVYTLGQAISGADDIPNLIGKITVKETAVPSLQTDSPVDQLPKEILSSIMEAKFVFLRLQFMELYKTC